MSDPITDRLRDLATATATLDPASPAEVRRRGDRLRRRRAALTATGAALAVALVIIPVAVITTDGTADLQPASPDATVSDSPSKESTGTPTDGAEPPGTDPAYPGLSPQLLPRARLLPTRTRLTPWQEVETSDQQLVGCQPDAGLGAEELLQRIFTARIGADDGLPAGEDVAAEVRVSVLQFGSEAEAEAAEATVTDWIRDCDDPAGSSLDRTSRQGDLTETESGTYATWVYAAPETCTDCGAVWFERMSVLADLGRMVVVSSRELGGPLEPEGLDPFMRDLMLQAAGGSMPG